MKICHTIAGIFLKSVKTDWEKVLQCFLDGHFLGMLKLAWPTLSMVAPVFVVSVGLACAPAVTKSALAVIGLAIAVPIGVSLVSHWQEITLSFIPWRWRMEWQVRQYRRRLARDPWRF